MYGYMGKILKINLTEGRIEEIRLDINLAQKFLGGAGLASYSLCYPKFEMSQNFPFSTPSGKIEIYSKNLADLNNPQLPPIPKYIEPWEGPQDPLAKKFPLQLITFHFKTRAHSNFYNIQWLRELEPHVVWINPVYARQREIEDGQKVRVFNDRGEVWIQAKITQRIIPGVVAIGQGAWHSPNGKGIDQGGCANVLTRNEAGPGGAIPTNTALVEVLPCEEGY